MKCPNCGAEDNFKTVDSRPKRWGIKRVKQCLSCNYRIATIEIHKISQEALNELQLTQYRLNK